MDILAIGTKVKVRRSSGSLIWTVISAHDPHNRQYTVCWLEDNEEKRKVIDENRIEEVALTTEIDPLQYVSCHEYGAQKTRISNNPMRSPGRMRSQRWALDTPSKGNWRNEMAQGNQLPAVAEQRASITSVVALPAQELPEAQTICNATATTSRSNAVSDGIICDLCGIEIKTKGGLTKHRDKTRCKLEAIRKNRTKAQSNRVNQAEQQPLDSVIQAYKQNTAVLPHVPKPARKAVAIALTTIIIECVNKNDYASWKRLLTFAFVVLAKPQKVSDGTLSDVIKANLEVLDSGAAFRTKRPKKTHGQEKSVADLNIEMAHASNRKISDGNVAGAVRLLSSDDGVAPRSEATVNELRSKHPAAPVNLQYPEVEVADSPHSITASEKEVRQALASFQQGSSGGLCALRPKHLTELIAGYEEPSVRLCEALSKLTTHIISGKVPDYVVSILHGGSITALKKKDGGIRPIAVGNTFRRLACKIVSKRILRSLGKKLRPTQLGCGVKGGAEAAVHATRHFLSEKTEAKRTLAKLDYANAYNTLRRDKIMHAVLRHMPQYTQFIKQFYQHSTHLFFDDIVISSECGVQQGCPPGPVLFCLVLADLTAELKSSLNVWYLDDGTIGGDVETVKQDVSMLIIRSAELGLHLNLKKCEILIPNVSDDEYQQVVNDIQSTCGELCAPPKNEWKLLGAPLNTESIDGVLQEKVAQLSRMSKKLSILPAHHALFLLKNCFAIPKTSYVLRTSPTWLRKHSLRAFDDVLRNAVAKITNIQMTEDVWSQASLPVRCGGLGMRTTEQISLPAFLASVYSVASIVSEIRPTATLEQLLMGANERWTTDGMQSPPAEKRAFQREWDSLLCEKVQRAMLANAQPEKAARLNSTSAAGAGAWAQALPSAVLGNLLSDDQLRIAVALRLGGIICQTHTCICDAPVDQLGQHGLSCIKSAGRFSRHGAINEIIKRAFVSGGIAAIREPKNMFRDDGKRSDGKTQEPFCKGKFLAWDVTVVDPLALKHLRSAQKAPGTPAKDAEEAKQEKYKDLDDNHVFCPVGFETFGAAGPSAQRLIKKLGKLITEKYGEPRATEFLRQKISIEIQRENAECVKGTLPKNRGLNEIFHVLGCK